MRPVCSSSPERKGGYGGKPWVSLCSFIGPRLRFSFAERSEAPRPGYGGKPWKVSLCSWAARPEPKVSAALIPKSEGACLDALARRGISRRGRIVGRAVRRDARGLACIRVVDLVHERCVPRHLREVIPLVRRV